MVIVAADRNSSHRRGPQQQSSPRAVASLMCFFNTLYIIPVAAKRQVQYNCIFEMAGIMFGPRHYFI